mgnify:CR=1 FL=1
MARLNLEQRYTIYGLLKAEKSIREIAKDINVAASTVSREIKRNKGLKGYRPKQAHEKAGKRQKNIPKFTRFTAQLKLVVDRYLNLDLSPEQIQGRLKLKGKKAVSPKTMYEYIVADKIEGGTLYTHLRGKGSKRKKNGSKEARGQIVDRVSIDERPSIVDENTEFGHWEIDLIVGSHHKGFLVTVVERVTKASLIGYSIKKDSKSIAAELVKILKPYKDCVKTITADNGKEFAEHKKVAKELEAAYYFAHPYSSWQRGLNENTNGLIRQYFPKGTDLRNVSQKELDFVMKRLNNRPRKTLNFETPEHLFNLKKPRVALVA